MPTPRRAAALAACAALALGAVPAAAHAAEDRTSAKIIEGRPAAPGAWPAQVALLSAFQPDAYQAQFCGGTLIAPTIVLTAAHCVEQGGGITPPDELDVAVGVTDLNSVTPDQRIPAADVLVHADYGAGDTLSNDIALIRLVRAVGTQPQRVIVPGLEPLQDAGEPARIVGWGSTSSNQSTPSYPSDLQEADLPLISDAECSARVHGIVPALMVCAGVGTAEDTDVDTCQGDSGGPLHTRDPRGFWRQVGLTSFGPTCGNAPTAYTELLAYHRWIEDNAGVDLNTYPDTGGVPFEPAVERAALFGVIAGFADGTFRPTQQVTRAQVASLLVRALGIVPTQEDADTERFRDVDPPHEANINALARLDIVQGYGDTYRPNDPVRRDQMASLLARALELTPRSGSQFSDLAGNVHAGNVYALVDAGVVTGYSDGTYRPTLPVARNTMAEFLVRGFL